MGAPRSKIKIDPDLQEIVPGYIEKRKKEITVLNNALVALDFGTLETMGHRLKGSGGGYGLIQLGNLGATLEAAAKAKDIGKLTRTIKEIEEYLSNLEVEF